MLPGGPEASWIAARFGSLGRLTLLIYLTETTSLVCAGNLEHIGFDEGERGRGFASLVGVTCCRCMGCFDWLSKLLNLQALPPLSRCGDFDLAASDWRREGDAVLRSLAQYIVVAWVASKRRPSGPTYRPNVSLVMREP